MINLTLAPASLPAGMRVYVIGDVHGCAARLRALHDQISRDIAARPVGEPVVVHLGDYIDRGPDSADVIEALLHPFPNGAGSPGPNETNSREANSRETHPRVINLTGNHEEMMLTALADRDAAPHWLANGGDIALESWGVPLRTRARDWEAAMPPRHLAFLRGLKLMHAAGGYLFVHAGMRPAVPLASQSRLDMLWIREPFLSFDGAFPAVVVHGHTPVSEPVIRHNRIGIDTGACMGGALTCVALEADRMGFLAS
jgi:serine/threonine protein phosphatase 1